jgi:hypothetical protein
VASLNLEVARTEIVPLRTGIGVSEPRQNRSAGLPKPLDLASVNTRSAAPLDDSCAMVRVPS